mmetsp:Transcript_42949/g.100973  ORF Transcript_42949/g.100973 Transcript_42949/m.100973 type:complete len:213 (+) Transcript_42949:691-1329(+)
MPKPLQHRHRHRPPRRSAATRVRRSLLPSAGRGTRSETRTRRPRTSATCLRSPWRVLWSRRTSRASPCPRATRNATTPPRRQAPPGPKTQCSRAGPSFTPWLSLRRPRKCRAKADSRGSCFWSAAASSSSSPWRWLAALWSQAVPTARASAYAPPRIHPCGSQLRAIWPRMSQSWLPTCACPLSGGRRCGWRERHWRWLAEAGEGRGAAQQA